MDVWFQNIAADFTNNFIADNRWQYLTNGLGITLLVTVVSAVVGIVIGFVVAIIRATHDKTGKLKIADAICRFYLTVIRGTPVLVQLLIIYFIIFTSRDVSQVFVAIVAFSVNSGAYVAEIFRSGIISIDAGQFEAGRSLGFNYRQTFWYIIMPQATKNVIPALVNEFIALLKETSIVGYIGLADLTRGGDIIRGRTFSAFMPLIAVAIVYLCIVMLISFAARRIERRLTRIGH